MTDNSTFILILKDKENKVKIHGPNVIKIFTQNKNTFLREVSTEEEIYYYKDSFWPHDPLPTGKYKLRLHLLFSY